MNSGNNMDSDGHVFREDDGEAHRSQDTLNANITTIGRASVRAPPSGGQFNYQTQAQKLSELGKELEVEESTSKNKDEDMIVLPHTQVNMLEPNEN
jgi:hypothetical protein